MNAQPTVIAPPGIVKSQTCLIEAPTPRIFPLPAMNKKKRPKQDMLEPLDCKYVCRRLLIACQIPEFAFCQDAVVDTALVQRPIVIRIRIL
jgi:hypothetical protein